MSQRRQTSISQAKSDPIPLWRVKPKPGPEQLELERMFNSKEIDPSSSPDSVRQSKEMFRKFSTTVFGNHFRRTKALCGVYGNALRYQSSFHT